ncbi:MAG: pentapeptide repeat-containing protein [bacterium]|nr:pentapeptide repeat-containing protein [bacterium]
MANPEHLRILQRGIKVWNLWRQENPDTKPDLSQVDRTRAYLSRANLSNTDLRGAIFLGANLKGANLHGANLAGANLLGAIGLAQTQLDFALGDEQTILPPGFRRPATWTKAPEDPPSQ